jgi:tetratricopeptide (TPR) repeat protein
MKAMDYFERAIKQDPTYALAYDGLADCYNYLGISGALLGGLPPKEVMPKAKELALKAIQLDATLAQPHRTLGHIHANYDYDWEDSEKELNRAIELNPNDSFTYSLQAFRLIALGRNKEALDAMQRFKELDPGYFPGKLMAVGIQFYWLRQYDNAIEQLKALNEMAPTYPNPYYWLGAAYLEKKDFNKAFDGFQKAVDCSHRAPVAVLGLAFAHARAGKIKEAENILAEVLDTSKKKYIPEFYVACVYGALGKKNEAFEWLDRTYKERANGLSTIKVNPMVDDLRSDPRFTEMLKKLNLI